VFDGKWNNGCFQDRLRKAAVGVTNAQCGFQ